jgi:hypothetical protein
MSTQPTILTPPSAVLVRDAWMPPEVEDALKHRRSHLAQAIRQVLRYVPRDDPYAAQMVAEVLDRLSSCVVLESRLSLQVFRGRQSLENFVDRRAFEDHGWTGYKVITTAGVAFLVDAWQNSVELEILKYHGIGTGSTTEAAADVALVTELTTEYTGDIRATGTLTEGASANIFRTVGVNTLDGTPGSALREHGIFSAASAGTLWDRTVYGAISLSSGDSLSSTYDMTASSGG